MLAQISSNPSHLSCFQDGLWTGGTSRDVGTEIRAACLWARISWTGCSFPETVEIAFIICDLESAAPGSDVIAYLIYGDDGAAEVLPGPALVCGRAFIGWD